MSAVELELGLRTVWRQESLPLSLLCCHGCLSGLLCPSHRLGRHGISYGLTGELFMTAVDFCEAGEPLPVPLGDRPLEGAFEENWGGRQMEWGSICSCLGAVSSVLLS